MADILIRDVPDDVIAALDARAGRLGLSRSEYVRRRLTEYAAASSVAPGASRPEQSAEDTDSGWGERPEADHDERLYGDRPPHWDA